MSTVGGRKKPPGRDALLISILMERASPADRKHLIRILKSTFGTDRKVKGLDPKGNPEDLSPKKARKILKHGSVRGKKLTRRQKRYMGAVAGGTARG